MFISRYSASEATGYVAEVSYEGTAITPIAVPAKLVKEAPRSQQLRRPSPQQQQARPQSASRNAPRAQQQRPQARPISKRNKNASDGDFNEYIEEPKQTSNKRQKKHQKKHQKNNFQSYYPYQL